GHGDAAAEGQRPCLILPSGGTRRSSSRRGFPPTSNPTRITCMPEGSAKASSGAPTARAMFLWTANTAVLFNLFGESWNLERAAELRADHVSDSCLLELGRYRAVLEGGRFTVGFSISFVGHTNSDGREGRVPFRERLACSISEAEVAS